MKMKMKKWTQLMIFLLIFLIILAIILPLLKDQNHQKDNEPELREELEFKISQEKTVYYYNEPVNINFSLKNIGTSTLKMQPFVIYGNVLANLTNSNGIKLKQLIMKDFGISPKDLVTLRPGEQHFKDVDIKCNFFIPPENYSLNAKYITHGSWYSGELDDSWRGTLVSNTLNFQVINDILENIIFIQNNVSGFTWPQFDHFTVVLDSKEIIKLHIEGLSEVSHDGDSELPNEEIEIIFNKIKDAVSKPSFSTYDDGYFVRLSMKETLSDVEYSNLLSAIEAADFPKLDEHYVPNMTATCMGTVYFTAKLNTNGTYKTVSCYDDTSGAPEGLRDLEIEVAEICKLRFC